MPGWCGPGPHSPEREATSSSHVVQDPHGSDFAGQAAFERRPATHHLTPAPALTAVHQTFRSLTFPPRSY